MGELVFSKAPSSLLSTYRTFSAMCQQAELTDVQLVSSDGEHYPAHRVVLASSCAYFHAMFTLDLAENRGDKVNMRDFESDVLGSIVQFCYGEEIRVSNDNIEFLLRLIVASDHLHLGELQRLCVDALISLISPVNVLSMQSFGVSYSISSIVKACKQHIEQNFEVVSTEEEYLQLPLSDVVEIVSNDCLKVLQEESVYQAVMNWILHDPEERSRFLPELLVHVRLPFVSPQCLKSIIEENQYLRDDLFCKGLIQEACFYQEFPSKRSILNSSPRSRPRQSSAASDVVLVAGGVDGSGAVDSLTRYNLATGEQVHLTPMPHKVYAMGACIIGDCLYIVGGHGDTVGVLSRVQSYNIKEGTWMEVASMKFARRYLSVAVVNGLIYAVGGQTKDGVTASVEFYDPAGDKWTACNPMHQSRMYHGAVVCEHMLYVVGGHDGFVRLSSLERYDPFTEKWVCLSAMSVPRSVAGVVVCRGSIFVAGGYVKGRHLSTVEEYDVELDQWSASSSMESPRSAFGLLAVEGTLYAMGGFGGSFLPEFERRMPPSDSGDGHGHWQVVDHCELKRAHFGVV